MWLPILLRSEPTHPPVPLTEDGQRAFDPAVRVSRRNRHEYISTEHLLVGITEAGPTPAGEALEQAGISSAAIRRRCDFVPGMGQVLGALPFTPTAKRVFAAAMWRAENAGSAAVDSLGLLLALAQDKDGVARELLSCVVAVEDTR